MVNSTVTQPVPSILSHPVYVYEWVWSSKVMLVFNMEGSVHVPTLDYFLGSYLPLCQCQLHWGWTLRSCLWFTRIYIAYNNFSFASSDTNTGNKVKVDMNLKYKKITHRNKWVNTENNYTLECSSLLFLKVKFYSPL